ncbi:hypothetical protein [Duck coronavirus DK/GD/27/2014]|uniref:Uncharacterized protein n=1 Tax=Duck coronavirus DK/GD/27/2014 TaxID=2849730 RepID=A0A0F6SKM8_9GAMC|nr:hypothetical protein HO267_gp12 [Duck coronavirus]AKF17733.1 hypothetical protein [Duck coronavirus DK/GD/27/2014]
MVCFTVISFVFYYIAQGYTFLTGELFTRQERAYARELILKFAVLYDTVLLIFLVGFFVGKRSKRSDRHVV